MNSFRFSRRSAVAAAPVLLAASLVGFPAARADAATSQTIYAAPQGTDTAAGSQDAPLSLAGAQMRVRTMIKAASGPITVLLYGGVYSLASTLNFGVEDSGTSDSPVTWKALDSNVPVITGGRTLTPAWTDYKNGIKVATLEKDLDFDQLFINGSRQILARYPDFNATPGVKLGGYAADAISPARIATWSNPTTGLVRALHDREWGGNSFRISGVNADGSAQLQWVGDNNRGSGINATERMVENVFEELNAPGEWFYDKPTGQLYLYPIPDSNLSGAQVGLGELNQLINVSGVSSSAPAHDIAFSGIKFTQTHRTLFNSSYEQELLGDWAIVRSGAVTIKNAQRISISNSTFVQLGGNAIFLDGYNSNVVVDNNDFDQIGASDVAVVGSKTAVRSPSSFESFQSSFADTTAGPASEDYPRDITISNNRMANMGIYELQTAGVQISTAARISVLNNTIHDGPRAAININDGTWGGHRIANNDIWNMVQQTGDHGPINAWGRDRWWPFSSPTGVSYSKNTPFDSATLRNDMKLDAIAPTVIDHNRIWHSSEWAVDLDDGSSNYVVKNNLLLNSGVKIRDGFERTVTNNVIVGGAIYPQVAFDNGGDTYTNNIVLGAAPYLLYGDDAATPSVSKSNYNSNDFWNNGGDVTIRRQDNGSSMTLSQWQQLGADAASKIAGPQFTNGNPWTNANQLDYTVGSSSPALALGFTNFPMDNFGRSSSTERPPALTTLGSAANAAGRESILEPWIGASISGITDNATASVVGLPVGQGIVLNPVPAGSGASAAGLQGNDVIVGINGNAVTNKNSLWTIWNSIPAGSTVTLSISRAQNPSTVTLSRPAGTEKINNTSGVIYTGSGWDWKYQNRGGTGSYLDDVDASIVAGDAFSLDFDGTGISMSTQTNSDEATVAISLDGGPETIVDLRSASRIFQTQVFTSGTLPAGKHHLTARSTSGGYFIVDSFSITR